MRNVKVGCPRFGPYSDIVTEIAQDLGWELIMPKTVSERTIEVGNRHMNELMCLPAKATLGGMVEAAEQGATDMIMFDSCGQCRLKTYYILQERALRSMGYHVKVHPIRLGITTPADLKRVDPKISYWRAWRAFLRLLLRVKRLDSTLWPTSPSDDSMVKIGIVGEIYTILEPAVNSRVIHKVEKQGAFVHNSLPLSFFLFRNLYHWGLMKRPGIDRARFLEAERRGKEYFPSDLGGHGKEAITHTIYYGMSGFDGVLHLLPFPCMPESTVAQILDDISHDFDLPMMRLIFDTHTAEAGVQTRIEAFTDILKMRKGARIKRDFQSGVGERKAEAAGETEEYPAAGS